MKLLTTLDSSYDKLKRLVVKVWNGKSRTLTAEESGPFGTDSRPPKGMVALYMKSEVDGAEAIIGYFNKNRLAEIGEHRIFSTDANGVLKTYIWLKNDGKILLGGDTNFSVKYNELATEFNKLKSDFNAFASAFNGHIHVAPGGNTATPTPVPTVIPVSANTSDITNAKNSNIKTN